MAKLFFKYSTMNAGKSLELIKVAYNYEERAKNVLTLLPNLIAEKTKHQIMSKTGIKRKAVSIMNDTNLLTLFIELNFQKPIDVVLVDEGQFLTIKQVEELAEIVDSFNVPVMVYGLKNDFQNNLFEGSKALLIYADKIEEIKTICWCGRKATMVARLDENGKFTKEGPQILIGGNETYVALCRKHYNDGRIGKEDTRPSE